MNIDVIIACAAWDEQRRIAASRLADSLPFQPLIVSSLEKEHANVWAPHVWEMALRNCADATLFLNDDVLPHPDLLAHVEQLVTLLPGEVISLHCQFDAVRTHAVAGKRLARCYWPSGPAYVLQGNDPADLLSFVDSLPTGFFAGHMNEDGIIANWLWRRQRPAYCTIPALVRHDTTIPSTLGYDLHPGRKSPVDWDDWMPGLWTKEDVESAPYIPTPWMNDNQYRELGEAIRGLKPLCGICLAAPASFINEARKTGVCFSCGTLVAKATAKTVSVPAAVAAPPVVDPVPLTPRVTPTLSGIKIVIATPLRGSAMWGSQVSLGHAEYKLKIARLYPTEFVPSTLGFSCDNVRARNRMIAWSRANFPDMTHMLFWDDDNWPQDTGLLGRMVQADVGIIGGPYVTKEDRPRWVHSPKIDADVDERGLLEVLGVGFGFTLISKQAIEAVETMSGHYWDTRLKKEIPDMCGLMMGSVVDDGEERQTMLSEDYSFCRRYIQTGGKVYIDARAGNVVLHAGLRVYSPGDMAEVAG